MTRLMSSMARTPATALLATATLVALNYDSKAPVTGEPKSTCFDAAPPRDLSDTHNALNLEGYAGVACVKVPDYVLNDTAMTTAMKLLVGSTINGRYIDDDAAKKLLADDHKSKSPGTFKARYGAGKQLDSVAVLTHELGLLRRAHHSEPRRIAGSPNIRGEHVAVH